MNFKNVIPYLASGLYSGLEIALWSLDTFFAIDKELRGLLHTSSRFKTICVSKEDILPVEEIFSQVCFLQTAYG